MGIRQYATIRIPARCRPCSNSHRGIKHCQHYPNPVSENLFGGVARNFQVFQPLDFLAEITQHIPNKGEHPIRYYGCYSNKHRGQRAKQAAAQTAGAESSAAAQPPPIRQSPSIDRRRWAILIQRIYQADPLRCPKCGGTMKIIAFIEAHQGDVIEKILRHCGLWHDPPPRAPPNSRSTPVPRDSDSRTFQADPDFLEHSRWEEEQPQLFPEP